MTHLLPGKKELEKGQAVLVVLLVMSVLLTLGLSVVSRSVTDIKISQQTQESARAFWTAQAGLEKALLAQGEIPPGNTIDGVSYAVTKYDLGGVTDFVFPEKISPGESVAYWLVDHDSDGNIGTSFYSGNSLTLYWGNDGDTDTALIVTLIYRDVLSGLFQSQKFTYDPSTSRTPPTNFTSSSPGDSLLGSDFAHTTGQIPVPELTYFANIKMIFNDTSQSIGVKTDLAGPVQGYCYESTATVDVSNIVRKLKECRTWPKTPEIFDYLLFSGGDLN